MPYLNCPRCGLAIRVRARWLETQHCPRCLGRAQLSVPMDVAGWPHRLDGDAGHVAAYAPAPV